MSLAFCKSLHENGPLLSDCGDPQYSKIVGFGFTLIAGDRRDNCFLTHDGTIVILRNITFNRRTNSLVIIGQYFTVKDLYILPCKSLLVGIYLVSKLSGLKHWPLKDIIKNKCFRVLLRCDMESFPFLRSMHLSNLPRDGGQVVRTCSGGNGRGNYWKRIIGDPNQRDHVVYTRFSVDQF